jgi:hypothetical protein
MAITDPFKIYTSEHNSFTYQTTLDPIQDSGESYTGSLLLVFETLTLTLRDASTGTVINSRDVQNVLNTNGVTLDDDGLLIWSATSADTPIITSTKKGNELHIATFEARYPAPGTGDAVAWDVFVYVRNLGKAI